MPRPVKIDVVGDAAQFLAAVRRGTAAVGDMGKSLKELGLEANKTNEKFIAASLKREARLRAEARSARKMAADSKLSDEAREHASRRAIQLEQRLSRHLNRPVHERTLNESISTRIKEQAAIQQGLKEEAMAFRQAAGDINRSEKDRAAATGLAEKAERDYARALHISTNAAKQQITAALGAGEAKVESSTMAAAAVKKELTAEEQLTAQTTQNAQKLKVLVDQRAALNRQLEQGTIATDQVAAAEATLVQIERKLAEAQGITRNQFLAKEKAARQAAAAQASGAKVALSAEEQTLQAARAEIEAMKQKVRASEADVAAKKSVLAQTVAGTETQKIATEQLARAEANLNLLRRKSGLAEAPSRTPMINVVKQRVEEQALLRNEVLELKRITEQTNISAEERMRAQELLNEKTREYQRLLGGTAAQVRKTSSIQIQESLAVQAQLEKEIAQYSSLLKSGTLTNEALIATERELEQAQLAHRHTVESLRFQTEAQAASMKKVEKNTGRAVRGALAGSGVFHAMGRELAFASGGFLAFAVASSTIRTAVTAAGDFQDEMDLIRTQAGKTAAEVQKVSKGVKAMAPEVGTDPQTLAKGLYHLESAGLSGSKALEALKISAKGALLGESDLEATTNALITVWKSGIGGITSFKDAMSAANAIVGQGNMRMEDLAQSFSTPLLATAKQAGLSIDEVGAALDTLSIAWGPNSNAAARLGMAINLLSGPTKEAQKQLAGIGLSATQLGDVMSKQGLIPALELLKQKLDASGKSAGEQRILLTQAFGGGKSSGAVKTLLQFVGTLTERQHKLNEEMGSFDEKWAVKVKEADFATKRWHASVQTMKIELGAGLLPTLTRTSNRFSDWMAKEKNQKEIRQDFNDGIRVSTGLLSGLTDSLRPMVSGFQEFSKVIGGTGRAMELLALSFIAFKANRMFFKKMEFGDITTAMEGIKASTMGATSKFMAFGEALKWAGMGMKDFLKTNGGMIGLVAGLFGPQIKNIPGMDNGFGNTLSKVVTNAGFGAFAGSFAPEKFRGPAMLAGASIGGGMALSKSIGGTTGSIVGNTLGFAGTGAAIGMTVGPEGAAIGAAAGAAVGLGKALIQLAMKTNDASRALSKIHDDQVKGKFAELRSGEGIKKLRDTLSSVRVSRDNAEVATNQARYQEEATRGTKQHAAALDYLRYTQREYMAQIRQVTALEKSLGSAVKNQKKIRDANKKSTQDEIKTFMDLVDQYKAAKQGSQDWGAADRMVFDKAGATAVQTKTLSESLHEMADSFRKNNKPMSDVASNLASIIDTLGSIPDNIKKQITWLVTYKTVFIPGKGVSGAGLNMDPRVQGHRHGDDRPSPVMNSLPEPVKKPYDGPIRDLKLPNRFAVAEAMSTSQKQDIVIAKQILAWVQGQIAGGRLVGQALIDAGNLRRQEMDAIAAAKKEKKKATNSISKLVSPQIREEVARARSSGDNFGLATALKHEIAWIKKKIASGDVNTNQKAALENEIGRARKEMAAALKKTVQNNWVAPLLLQLEEAKAGATINIDSDDLNVAKKIKTAAMKALKSGKLGITAQIDAWNAIAAVNEKLAGGSKNAFTTWEGVSSRAIIAGLNLTKSEKKLIQERYAQAQAHNSMRPTNPAVMGQGVIIHGDIHVHGVQSESELYQMLQKQHRTKAKPQRRGTRR